MYKKYIYPVAFLFLCLGILLFVFLKCKSQMETMHKINQDLIEENNISESIESLIIGNVFLQFETTDSRIEDLIITSNNDNNKRLSNYLCSVNRLILRYNEDNCSSCIDHSLDALLEYKDAIGIENILIISTVRNNRKLKAFIDKYEDLNIQIINTKSEINLPIEEYNIPYFFVINENLELKMLFVPIKELPHNTARYLDIISQRFIAKNIF